jgi:hypothetical protein
VTGTWTHTRPQCIQDDRHINNLLQHRPSYRGDIPGRGNDHRDATQGNASPHALSGNGHRALADLKGVDKPAEVVNQDHHVCSFCRYSAPVPCQRDTNSGRTQRWGVVRSVANHEYLMPLGRELMDRDHFIFRGQVAPDLRDSDSVCDRLGIHEVIACEKYHALNAECV